MLKAAIFDMDGLLVDSEPFWQQAQLDILQPLGVEITRHDTTLTTGVRIDQIVNLWYSRFLGLRRVKKPSLIRLYNVLVNWLPNTNL